MPNKLVGIAAAALVAVGMATTADAALLKLTGGTQYTTSGGNAANKNDVIGGGYKLFDNARLDTTAANVSLSFYFLGAESGYVNKLTTAFGNHTETNGAPPAFPFGFPGISLPGLGGVQAAAGKVQTNFTSPSYGGIIGNKSPIKDASGRIIGSVAFAYLKDLTTFAISAAPTNFVLFALDDGGASRDDNHDDYMGVVVATPIPAALPLLLSAVAGLGLISRRRSEAAV